MREGQQLSSGPANGCAVPGRDGWKQLVVRMDEETFDEIRRRAIRENTSVAQQIRLLIEWGLEAENV